MRQVIADESERDAARAYLLAVGLTPTPDAVEQLSGPFTAALTIMCERGYAEDGALWQEAGWKPQLYEAMKKLDRIEFYAWSGKDPEAALKEVPDVINYMGFFMRGVIGGIVKWSRKWGEPA